MGMPQTLESASPGVLSAPVLLGKAGGHMHACTPPALTSKSTEEGMF